MENSSLELVTGCVKQDPRFQKILYEACYGKLMKVAFRYVSTYEQAVEFTQNGFVKIFHEFSRFRLDRNMTTRESLSKWIKKIFIISVVDQMKAERWSQMPKPIPDDVWKQYDRPLTEIETTNIELIKILKGLPTLWRLVFNLNVMDGFTHIEIARMLGITVMGSKHNLNKARAYCHQFLVVDTRQAYHLNIS